MASAASETASGKNSFEQLLEFLKSERKKAERVLQVKDTKSKERNKDDKDKFNKKDKYKKKQDEENHISNYAGGGTQDKKKKFIRTENI